MSLKKFRPRVLTKAIKSIYFLRTDRVSDELELHRHLPDGTFDLILNLGDPIYHINAQSEMRRPDNILIGGVSEAFYLKYPKRTWLACVVFQPGYASLFLKDRLDSVTAQTIESSLIYGKDVHQLEQELRANIEDEQRAWLLEQFLIRKADSKPSYYHERMAYTCDLISRCDKMSMSNLSSEVCMSERNFRRIFKELVGYTPKQFAKIRRIKKVMYLLKDKRRILECAIQLGFYDTAHLIHDFQSIAGTSPVTFSEKFDRLDEIFMSFNN